jgi:hypothetical protein
LPVSALPLPLAQDVEQPREAPVQVNSDGVEPRAKIVQLGLYAPAVLPLVLGLSGLLRVTHWLHPRESISLTTMHWDLR